MWIIPPHEKIKSESELQLMLLSHEKVESESELQVVLLPHENVESESDAALTTKSRKWTASDDAPL